MFAVSETKERINTSPCLQNIPGFHSWPYPRETGNKGGGGLCMLYKNNLHATPWYPSVSPENKYLDRERQWLLIEGNRERLAFLHVYIACQNNSNDSYLKWNEDLFTMITEETLTLKAQGFSILAMGDFNTRVGQIPGLENNLPDVNNNHPMFLNFIQCTNLIIINTLPVSKGLFTRFMNGSDLPGTKSLLDYGLRDADSVHTVSSFVIDKSARFDCGTDHALLEAEITFGWRTSLHWNLNEAIQFNFSSSRSFMAFEGELDLLCSSIPHEEFEGLSSEEMVQHLTSTIKQTGMKIYGIKLKKTTRGRNLPKYIIENIKHKNFLCRRLTEAYLQNDSISIEKLTDDIVKIKADIKSQIALVKIKRRKRIRSRIIRDDPCRKKFWAFLKNQIRAAGNITCK